MRLAGWASALLVVGVVACGNKDARITSDVKDRLSREPVTAAVDVQTNQGIVTLTGYVDDESEKGRIDDAVRDVKGVFAVDNRLQIRRPTTITGAPVEKP